MVDIEYKPKVNVLLKGVPIKTRTVVWSLLSLLFNITLEVQVKTIRQTAYMKQIFGGRTRFLLLTDDMLIYIYFPN